MLFADQTIAPVRRLLAIGDVTCVVMGQQHRPLSQTKVHIQNVSCRYLNCGEKINDVPFLYVYSVVGIDFLLSC